MSRQDRLAAIAEADWKFRTSLPEDTDAKLVEATPDQEQAWHDLLGDKSEG